MKKKYLFISLLFLLTLSACSNSKFEPVLANGESDNDSYNQLKNKEVFELYKSKHKQNETIDKLLYLEMDGNYEGKELFVLSHTKNKTFFKVFSFNPKTENFKKIYKKETDYNKNRVYFVQGVIPFSNNETEHILIGRYNLPTMSYNYLLIGKTIKNNKISIIIDNATKDSAIPIQKGTANVDSSGITILSNDSYVERHYISEETYKSTKGVIEPN
ncbi:hypothetical protein AAGG74_17385 [Bacillus mexicanus]|uniref:hypothetical protein n=1 Tax=Bacillus mexicanus TaxID=2834415 RepID=UPI003D2468D9